MQKHIAYALLALPCGSSPPTAPRALKRRGALRDAPIDFLLPAKRQLRFLLMSMMSFCAAPKNRRGTLFARPLARRRNRPPPCLLAAGGRAKTQPTYCLTQLSPTR